MKLQMVGSHTPPKGNAMPEDCIICHNAEWGTIVVDSICIKCLVEELAARREAGEKMARILKWELNEGNLKDSETLAALAEWEAANK